MTTLISNLTKVIFLILRWQIVPKRLDYQHKNQNHKSFIQLNSDTLQIFNENNQRNSEKNELSAKLSEKRRNKHIYSDRFPAEKGYKAEANRRRKLDPGFKEISSEQLNPLHFEEVKSVICTFNEKSSESSLSDKRKAKFDFKKNLSKLMNTLQCHNQHLFQGKALKMHIQQG